MMGPRQEAQAALFYEFSLDDHVPQDHLLRSIDRFVDLSSIRAYGEGGNHPISFETFAALIANVRSPPAPAKPARTAICEVSALSGFATACALGDTSALQTR